MAKFTLKPGQWFMYSIDQPIPSKVSIYTGDVFHRQKIATITRMQALALKRWHSDPGIYHSYRDGNGNYRDVRVVGDIDAWHGQQDRRAASPHS